MSTLPHLALTLDSAVTVFPPGGEVSGTATWQGIQPGQPVSLSLYWIASGEGGDDVEIIQTLSFDHPQSDESRHFAFQLPEGPMSFIGALISLRWGIEMIANETHSTRVIFDVSKHGRPIVLQAVESSAPGKSWLQRWLRGQR